MAEPKYQTPPEALVEIDSQESIQSQYAASPRIQALLQAMARQIEPLPEIQLFFEKIFDPETAEGVGLDIWGRIVGANREIKIQNTEFFGFALSDLLPFNQAPFWNSAGDSGVYELADQVFRELIFYKAMGNISSSTMESLNNLLNLLMTSIHGETNGQCFVIETGTMEIRAVFLFLLTSFELAMLNKYSLLNRGAGVGFSFFQIKPEEVFGFAGSGLQPFNQGVFNPYPIIKIS